MTTQEVFEMVSISDICDRAIAVRPIRTVRVVFCSFFMSIWAFLASAEIMVPVKADLKAVIGADGRYTLRTECLSTLKESTDSRTATFLRAFHNIENEYISSGSPYIPSRVIGEIRIDLAQDDIHRICNLIDIEAQKRPTDWGIISAAVDALGLSQQHQVIVDTLENILIIPLDYEDEGRKQFSAIYTIMNILAQQDTTKSLDLLLQCAMLPVKSSPKILPASTEFQNNPTELEDRRRQIAHSAAIAVLGFTAQDSVLPFFEALAAAGATDKTFSEEVAIHMETALRIAAGDKDPSGTPREER